MRFIGDVHGRFEQYCEIIKGCPASIQIGDMGIGFIHKTGPKEGEYWPWPLYHAMDKGSHRFIRGNHDNPYECSRHSQFIPDGTIERDSMGNPIMFIGGP